MCVQVKVEGDNEPQPSAPREEGMVPFVFVGTRENIANAKVLVEYHVAHLKVHYWAIYCMYLGDQSRLVFLTF